MTTKTYVLVAKPHISHHGDRLASLPTWLADLDGDSVSGIGSGEVRDFNIIDAMAASGDYFITLATRLDKLAQGMPQDSAEQIELEHLIKTLFYMQEHYALVAKYKLKGLQ